VTPLLKPWQFMLLTLAGWINRSQQEAIEYLRAENQVLSPLFVRQPQPLALELLGQVDTSAKGSGAAANGEGSRTVGAAHG
jgi:hypothetical protein